MMDKSAKRKLQAPLSLNPIFNFEFLQTEDAMRDRKSLSLPRIENKSLRETVATCLGKDRLMHKDITERQNEPLRRRDF